ncbi:hypothetical protein H206_05489 [Candidatus Electrothrix aarhusensis]|uniref:Uncharacterized protein n=1 Tax=Candidatus Electrothrix aarhusensis TaxID=1859131 RepID=A0A3S3QHY5_9BACT|nr:hypothetical protein H206_05489 [Candidatus Electrothrix aarhusensis]
MFARIVRTATYIGMNRQQREGSCEQSEYFSGGR